MPPYLAHGKLSRPAAIWSGLLSAAFLLRDGAGYPEVGEPEFAGADAEPVVAFRCAFRCPKARQRYLREACGA